MKPVREPMGAAQKLAAAAVLLILFGSAIAYLGARDYGDGVDGGTHYGIALELARLGTWPLPPSSPFYWVAYYPPGAHFLAVVAGAFTGSTLHGLFILTAISVVVFYLVVADLMRSPSPLKTIACFLVFIALAYRFWKFRFLAGNEMIINFFFGQFVGNAALMAGLYVAYRSIELSFRRWLVVSAILTHLVGWIYPLSAIELAFTLAILRGAPMADLRYDIKRRCIEIVVSGIVLGAAAIIHPAITIMVGISANDGGIAIANRTILVIIAGAAVVIPIFFYRFMGTGSVRAGALFALSLGALGPCVGLGLLHLAGLGGSLYAVKKSGFLLGTVACIMLSILIVELTAKIVQLRAEWFKGFHLPPISGLQTMVSSCLFVAIVVACIFQGRKSEPVSRLIAFDYDVRQLLAQETSDRLYGTTLLLNSSATPHANFLIGYPLLRQAVAAGNQESLFFAPRSPNLNGLKFVIINAAEANRYEQRCVMGSSERLTVITPDCLTPKPQ